MSSIQGYLIPVVIARRHKGALEVTSNWSIDSPQVSNPLDLLNLTTGCSRMTCSLESLSEQIQNDRAFDKIDSVSLDVNFNYHLDRATPQFETAAYQASCGFIVEKDLQGIKSAMYVNLPVIIKDVVTRVASLKFVVYSPVITYFEDLIDFVQKNGSIRLYPLMSSADSEALPGVLGNGKSVEEYIKILTRFDLVSSLGSSGVLTIKMLELYGSFNIEHKATWGLI